MELKRVDPDYRQLPDAYQIAALRGTLTGKYNYHIVMKLAARDYDKDELLNEVRMYATLKRTEVNTKPKAMEERECAIKQANMAMGKCPRPHSPNPVPLEWCRSLVRWMKDRMSWGEGLASACRTSKKAFNEDFVVVVTADHNALQHTTHKYTGLDYV